MTLPYKNPSTPPPPPSHNPPDGLDDRLLAKLRNSILFIGVLIIIVVLTNFWLVYEDQRTMDIVYMSVLTANESAVNAEKALLQTQINSIAIQEHEKIVANHASETDTNHNIMKNRTAEILDFLEKHSK